MDERERVTLKVWLYTNRETGSPSRGVPIGPEGAVSAYLYEVAGAGRRLWVEYANANFVNVFGYCTETERQELEDETKAFFKNYDLDLGRSNFEFECMPPQKSRQQMILKAIECWKDEAEETPKNTVYKIEE